jgi:hypothetical protein
MEANRIVRLATRPPTRQGVRADVRIVLSSEAASNGMLAACSLFGTLNAARDVRRGTRMGVAIYARVSMANNADARVAVCFSLPEGNLCRALRSTE